jgi:hypothetical protein
VLIKLVCERSVIELSGVATIFIRQDEEGVAGTFHIYELPTAASLMDIHETPLFVVYCNLTGVDAETPVQRIRCISPTVHFSEPFGSTIFTICEKPGNIIVRNNEVTRVASRTDSGEFIVVGNYCN